jgi:hypothetical protein
MIEIDKDNEIMFNKSFRFDERENVVRKSLEIFRSNPENQTIDLNSCGSFESGFTLPLEKVMQNAVIRQNPAQSKILDYHGSTRSFRFIVNSLNDDGIVSGLRCKDDMKYWTTAEKQMLKSLVDHTINKMDESNQ